MAVFWSSTSFTDANANLMTGSTPQTNKGTMIFGFRIRYAGAAWEAMSGIGLEAAEGANLSYVWDGTNGILKITISGLANTFSQLPVVMATPSNAAAVHSPVAHANTASELWVSWRNWQGTPADTLIKTEDTSMDCQLLVFGEVG